MHLAGQLLDRVGSPVAQRLRPVGHSRRSQQRWVPERYPSLRVTIPGPHAHLLCTRRLRVADLHRCGTYTEGLDGRGGRRRGQEDAAAAGPERREEVHRACAPTPGR